MNKLQKALKDNGILQWQAAEYIEMRRDGEQEQSRHDTRSSCAEPCGMHRDCRQQRDDSLEVIKSGTGGS